VKIWNIAVSQKDGGAKHLDLQIHGVIDGGWMDDSSTSTAEIAKALAEHPDAATIDQHINSVGGSLFGGIALYNILEAHPAKVTSYVDGLAASAASIIAMAGKTVMGRGAMMMIHNPWAGVAGDAQELRKAAAFLDKARDGLVSVYKAKTGKDSTSLKAMLDATTFLTAEEALRKGFADEIASGDAADPVVEDQGATVLFNAAAFPRESLTPQILAMAKAPAPVNRTPPATRKEEPEMEITREVLAAKAPELLKALLEEGKKAGAEAAHAAGRDEGVAAERERLKAIDELKIKGCDDLVAAAKYGDKPGDKASLCVAVVEAGKQAGADLLAARAAESAAAAAVKQNNPETQNKTEEEERLVRAIVGNNNPPGGSR
jgi:ATP-dependent Clp protease protease subunit